MQRVSFLVCTILVCVSCQNFDYSGKGKDVPTAGNLAIGIENSDSFLFTEEIDLFQAQYPNAHVHAKHFCEVALLRQLQMDSLRFVVMNRDFTLSEKENLEARDIKVRSTKIAETSIAIIVNQSNTLDTLTQQTWRDILSGKQANWANGNAISVAFDNSCGSAYGYFSKVFLKGKIEPANAGFLSTSNKVLDYIAQHPNSIGVVGLNWIADHTDSQSVAFNKNIKVLKVQNTRDGKFHYPYQSQIKLKQYPFAQEVFMHNLQGYNGLGNGFIAFVLSQPGQILVKKSGLLPAIDYGRSIIMEDE